MKVRGDVAPLLFEDPDDFRSALTLKGVPAFRGDLHGIHVPFYLRLDFHGLLFSLISSSPPFEALFVICWDLPGGHGLWVPFVILADLT